MCRVLLVEDNEAVRKGFKRILREAFGDVRFGIARNAQEALIAGMAEAWDLVILDVRLPDQCGLEVLTFLHHHCKTLPVLVVSTLPESVYAWSALKCGARGYVSKRSAGEELAAACGALLAGGTYVSNGLTAARHALIAQSARGTVATATRRRGGKSPGALK